MKTRTTIKSLSILICSAIMAFGLISCDRYCMEGNGRIESEYRVVSDFNAIENSTSFDVKISYDTTTSIRVDADENLLEYINTTVRDGRLVIESDNGQCVKSYSSALINIKMPELQRVELYGSGSMDIYSFNCSNITIKNTGSGDIEVREMLAGKISAILSGSGDIYLDGNADEVNYSVSGSGDINAFDMEAKDGIVKNSGSGDVSCHVTNTLDVTLTGSGDVVYSGPSTLDVTKEDSGSGDIYQRD
jgi:hypothetical protein